MLKSLTFGGSLVLLASAATAQQQMQARPVQSQLKDAGVYHLATGTWSRGQVTTGTPKVLYTNSANTGFFGVMGVAADLIWTDEGRIPSTSGHSGATADSYVVQQMQIAYCSSVAGPQNGGIIFYDCYTACTDILGLTPIAAFGFQVPGAGAGSVGCWLVTFDITGTSLEFKISGDCDGSFDGTSALDNFGWTIVLNDQGTVGGNGPFLNGDPNNYAYGDGTYYQNPGASYGTGLGTADQFWLNDITGTFGNGCYWFGGYPAGNPFSSFWLTLVGVDNGGGIGTKYCSANNNSTGAPADISATSLTPVSLTAAPVPNQPGIFFYANNQNAVPFGCSFLCATGQTVRGIVVNASGNTVSYIYDGSDAKHTLPSGQTKNFQYWYRDPMNQANCGGQTFNTSNGIQIAIP